MATMFPVEHSNQRLYVKVTYLSRKPLGKSHFVAGVSILCLLAISSIYWVDGNGVGALLPAHRSGVFESAQYWRLLTSIGAHSDLQHFLANGIAFGILSYLLYGYYGPWIYPLLTWLLGGLVTGLTLLTYESRVALLGASGVVYLMAGFWLTLYLFIERTLGPGKRLLRAAGFALIVLMPTTFKPMVSYRAHAIGFAVGVLFASGVFFVRKASFRSAERTEWE